jgi:protein-S-isoprenylcysteine O-methyltransferase Ste14
MHGSSARNGPARGGSSNAAPLAARQHHNDNQHRLRSAAAYLLNPRTCNALHLAKLLTASLLVALVATHPGGAAGVASNVRCCTYLALHGSYLCYWFLHPLLSPGWCAAVFPGDVGGARALAQMLAVLGAAYALPGALAFRNQAPLSPAAAAVATVAFVLGSLTNAAADFYKAGAKDSGFRGAVTGGPYAHLRHPNWVGDWIRYAALAAVAGHPAAFAVPAYIVYLNFSAQSARRRALAAKKAR